MYCLCKGLHFLYIVAPDNVYSTSNGINPENSFCCFLCFFSRDALNLLKASPPPKATPVVATATVPTPVQSPTHTPTGPPPPPGSRPNIPPLSVPGKPGAPVSYLNFIIPKYIHLCVLPFSLKWSYSGAKKYLP